MVAKCEVAQYVLSDPAQQEALLADITSHAQRGSDSADMLMAAQLNLLAGHAETAQSLLAQPAQDPNYAGQVETINHALAGSTPAAN